MRKEYRTTACFRLHTHEDMLEEGIIGTALRRHTQNIPAVLVRFESGAIPLTHGVWRIGYNHVKLAELAIFRESGTRQCISVDDFKILNAVQKEVHASNGTTKHIDFLPI